MRTLSKIALFVLIAGIFAAGCKKSDEVETTQQEKVVNTPFEYLKTAEGNKAFTEVFMEHVDETTLKEGSEFMVPMFTQNSFGVIRDLVFDPTIPAIVSGELASFAAEYDDNDFWRVNPDGTIRIHLTSEEADGYYYNFGTMQELTGEECHLNMNYTGEIVEFPIPFPPFVIYFVSSVNPPAVVYKGQGKVMDQSTGDDYRLMASVIGRANGSMKVTMELR